MAGFSLLSSKSLKPFLERSKVAFRFDDIFDLNSIHKKYLEQLLEYSVRLNLEVVPALLHDDTTHWIRSLTRLRQVEVHQHGYRHINHEIVGKKSEFGADRKLDDKLRDVKVGMNILSEQFGEMFYKVFCPPWNRMDKETEKICDSLHFAGVSCFKGYSLDSLSRLKNVSATLQWPDSMASYTMAAEDVADQMAMLREAKQALNIMVHINNMTPASFQLLTSLILLMRQEGVETATFSEIME